jgi:hypothetical protein
MKNETPFPKRSGVLFSPILDEVNQMPRNKKSDQKPIEQYNHKGKKRVNNPLVGLVTPETDRETGKKKYAYDPHLDPQLQWAGKAEHTSFEVPTVSLHVHERIDPRTIIEAVQKRNDVGARLAVPSQTSMFSSQEENPPLREAIEFYKHSHNWSNRLIAGDSLVVINSLLEKEGMAGKVQMIYLDPEAAKDIDELDPLKTGMTFLKAQMNADLLTDDLKKKRTSNESFWLIGQPDIRLHVIARNPPKADDEAISKKKKGIASPPAADRNDTSVQYQIEVLGFDYYNTRTGTIESGGTDKIALWMLDTDYDGWSLFPKQVFFPMAGEKEGWSKLARNLKAEIDEELIEAYRGTVSLPFEPGKNKRIAIKIVDDRGIESLKIMEVE